MNRVLILSLLGVLGCRPDAGSDAVTVVSPEPVAELPEPLTRVGGIRELPNGKVLVVDVQDKLVQLVDFSAGTVTKVGRAGKGPGEYAMPMGLLPLPGGKTLVNDLMGRRFLALDENGTPGEFLHMPELGGPGFIGVGDGGADGQGRLYFEAPPFGDPLGGGTGPGDPAFKAPDSTAILRWDRVSTRLDTVGWKAVPKIEMSNATGGGGDVTFAFGGPKVFGPGEAWGVAADGSVARVTPNPYRVLWYHPGASTPVAGPIQPYVPIEVTEADKKAYTEATKKERPMSIFISGPGGDASEGPMPDLKMPPPKFEPTKPPFLADRAVLVSPNGEVWVLRTRVAGDDVPVYDVFDSAGTLVRQLKLKPGSAVVGFGEKTFYVTRIDADDLQHLQRFKR